ncbi:IS21-like element helper ATPase IstB [Desulforamulus ferrireducens]|uniref:AAA family ATPase n=1 Tax=Desulforamulus ferrireducens TaxID=1833852 RepID=A0A1S6ITD6_9FIRM|nr:IS21-like element helper ATPase IstB [Desulforamulus ferrireducens]AQS58041.1 AAA family ATPase [Desulforamulus ferrireducens]AQS60248.1 AAA family ATPase [Desulforamulus ferrireducens]
MREHLDPREALVDIYCKQLKLPGLKASFRELARDAMEQNQTPTAFLAACLAKEVEMRVQKRLSTRLKQAKFNEIKTLEGFDFNSIPKLPKTKVISLAECKFIKERENIICIGQSGTGKSHIATAIGITAIQLGYRVRFIKVYDLIQELLKAESEYRLPRYLKNWNKYDLVILDELGYINLGTGSPLLFQFCSERYERGSLIITTNLDFSRWEEVFGDNALTIALLDRLTHHAHVLPFVGESYRFKESKEKLHPQI